MPVRRIMRVYHFLIAFIVLLLDRLTKRLVAKDISLHDSVTVIKRVFYITHVENRGAAFGIFNDSPSQWKIGLLVLFSIIALVIVSALLWKKQPHSYRQRYRLIPHSRRRAGQSMGPSAERSRSGFSSRLYRFVSVAGI